MPTDPQGEPDTATSHEPHTEPGHASLPTTRGPLAPKAKFKRIGMEAQVAVLKHHADGLTTREIARITGIGHQRVSEITTKHGSLKDQVRQVLDLQRVNAAKAWGRAIPKAAKKGDHRPARELLIATGDVSPSDSTGSGISVIVNMPGSQPEMGAKVAGSASTLDNPFVMPSSQVVEE